jgi:hypothetical protein
VPETEEFRSFDTHGNIWPQLLTLAEANGWKAEGTHPDEPQDRPNTFKPDYDPEDWLHAKRVSARDAANLANALSRVRDAIVRGNLRPFPRSPRPTILGDAMTQDQILAVNRGISAELLDEFIAFLRSGEFVFAWDD